MFAINSYANVFATAHPSQGDAVSEAGSTAAENTKTVHPSALSTNFQAAINRNPECTVLKKIDSRPPEAATAPARAFRLAASVTDKDVKQYLKTHKYADRDFRTGKYDPISNVLPPLRDRFNKRLEITAISSRGVAAETDKRFSSELITDYLKTTDIHTKAKLYEKNISYKTFHKKHMQSEGEAPLVGQGMVVARKALGPGTPVGVYAVQKMPPQHANPYDPFCMDMTWVGEGAPHTIVSGDNLLSKVNSTFEYDQEGYPIRQAPKGSYNLEVVQFTIHAKVANEPVKPYLLNAFFTTKSIAKGEELRVNYGYDEKTLGQMTQKMQHLSSAISPKATIPGENTRRH